MLAKIPWIALILLHIAPASALFRPASLTSLYGLPANSALLPLMQHRAALFLCIVIAAAWAMFDPGVRKMSFVLIGISMVSFLVIYLLAGQPSELRTIAIADLACVPFLLWAGYQAFGGTVE